ncbi:unnamed protein product [Symbiodinium natans]|uniref:Uncharacterized protein n=1 Tax=Symbiodinium natans TaxID=878477 RepID=A0A812S3E7_9DINO|nr:unnamed protein product [Symbiodinium natans]
MGIDALRRVRTLLAEVESSAKELFEAGRLDATAARGRVEILLVQLYIGVLSALRA